MNIINLSEFENTSVAKIDINGTTVAVFKVDDDYYAIQNMCSHAEADLADGEVYDCKVECPLHGAEFDLKTCGCGWSYWSRNLTRLLLRLRVSA